MVSFPESSAAFVAYIVKINYVTKAEEVYGYVTEVEFNTMIHMKICMHAFTHHVSAVVKSFQYL